MNFSESLRIAIDSLLINRLRAVLTTLGIVIGVGAVIGLVSLGRGVEDFIAGEFEGLGANVLTVTTTRPTSPTRTRIAPLTTIEANNLAQPLVAPNIRRVGIEYNLGAVIVGGTGNSRLNVSGVSANFTEIQQWPVIIGDFISDEDVARAARVAVLGLDVVEDLYGVRDFNPVGQVVRINDRTFTVIGVMEERGGTFVSEDERVFIPVTTAQTRLANARTADGGYRVHVIYLDTFSEDVSETARQEAEAYLNVAHDINFVGEQDYSISSSGDLLDLIRQITSVLTIFLTMIAGISLLVGGIGVMNIMLVSVTERTGEIGLRKAVGARAADILSQFLIESVILSLLGGALGIVVGWLASVIGTALIPDLTLTLSLDVILLATGVSTFVGVFFGFYPAWRASQMSPLEALRFE